MPLRIAELVVHPVKSCARLLVSEARVTPTGLDGDRCFMVVDGDGRFLSQRTHPVMATIRTAIDADSVTLFHATAGSVRVSRDDGPNGRRKATVWNDSLEAEDAGDEAADFVSSVLGIQARLVRLPGDVHRMVSSRSGRAGDRVSFADAFPFLVTSTASLDELNRRLDEPVGMDRFRPNIVIEGCAPHDEDGWAAMRAGGITFHLVKPCARCSVVAVDQRRGALAPAILKVLATYRTVDGEILFGQNAVHDGEGTLRVGDEIEVEPRAT
jgi:uncharacterized protein YcbX